MFARSDPAGIWCALKFPWGLNPHPDHQQRWLPATGCSPPPSAKGISRPLRTCGSYKLHLLGEHKRLNIKLSWGEGCRSMCLSLDCHTRTHTHTCACKHMCAHAHTCIHSTHARTYTQYTQTYRICARTHVHNTYIYTIHTCPRTRTCTMHNTRTCINVCTHIDICTEMHAHMHNIQVYTHICTIHDPCTHIY